MLKIQRFINELLTSNCYVVVDTDTLHCFIVDPASEKSLKEIEYIETNNLTLDYIFITHEHADHLWGVNSLIDKFSSKVICTEVCKESISRECSIFFRLYDNPNYRYDIKNIDNTIENLRYNLKWQNYTISFVHTPGHCKGAMCILLDNILFTGDTLIKDIRTVTKFKGGSEEKLLDSINWIETLKGRGIVIYAGHEEPFELDGYDLKKATKRKLMIE